MTKALAKTFGVELEVVKEEPIMEILPANVVELKQPPDPKDVAEDYKLARDTFHEIIKTGKEAVKSLEKVSKECETTRESIRVAEVMAIMMKTLSDTTKDMFDLQKKTKDLKSDAGATKTKQETNMNIDKAVFVGTSADLLKKAKSE